MTREDLLDEIEAIGAIYPDSLVAQGPIFQLLIPDRDIILQISFPSAYPAEPPHILSVYSKSYEGLTKEALEDVLHNIFNVDQVCLFEFIEAILETYEEQDHDEQESTEEDLQATQIAVSKEDLTQSIKKHWTASNAIVDRKSTFIAFAARVESTAEVASLLSLLMEDKHIQRSSHNMTAYRIKNPKNGIVIQDCNDDGETAAGGRLLHLLAVCVNGHYSCSANYCDFYTMLTDEDIAD